MEIFGSLAIVAFAALIHASFQLSVSALTLMSGHAIGKRTAHLRLIRLVGSFLFGVAVMTTLLISTGAFIAGSLLQGGESVLAWSICCGILLALGVSVWLFYYRKQSRGTTLWLPRSLATFLTNRSKRTHSNGEAFGLGLISVITESLFLMGPIVVSSLVLVRLPPAWQLVGVSLYVVISMLSLLIVSVLIGGGRGLGTIQKWRESNKEFLQFAAGGGLLILGMYVYVEEVATATVRASGGM